MLSRSAVKNGCRVERDCRPTGQYGPERLRRERPDGRRILDGGYDLQPQAINAQTATASAFDMNQRQLLERLVENAMDFLSQSIRELFDGQPKYSVIHFHAAVELFLKARLMAEHWSLVVARHKEPDWDRFVAGDFVSVSLEEAAKKLDRVVRSGLGKQELSAFLRVTKHRNKMVHFFHEGVSADENDKLRQQAAKELLTAWYLLHRLLTSKWSDVFSPWFQKIGEIDGDLRTLKEFLEVVYRHVAPQIDSRTRNGAVFSACPSCGFTSQEHEDWVGDIYEAECLVCGFSDKCLTIECPECHEAVRFVNEGVGECGNCGRMLEPEQVAEALVDEGAAYIAMTDGDDSWDLGNCSECDGYHTVARLSEDGDRYLCAWCFGEFESMQVCGWCNELNTGDMADSFWSGCSVCDGRAGHDRHRDD